MANVPTLFRVAFAILGVATILFLAGFASNYWGIVERPGYRKFNYGLWTVCRKDIGCVSLDVLLGGTPAHAYVARFCTIYELISIIVAVILVLLFLFKSAIEKWIKSAYSLLISGGILGFLGAIIFIARDKALDTGGYLTVSWSGVLVILAALAQIAAGVLVLLPVRKGEVQFDQA